MLHPRRGLLVLEVKDWRLETIQRIDKTRVTLLTARGAKEVFNPFEQARIYAQAAASLLEKDPQLVTPEHRPYQGRLCFPWSYGVVLAGITRGQFEGTDLGEVLPPHRVVCKDEIVESVDPEAFQKRLWDMFPWHFGGVLTLPQIDRIRWHLFPEIRIFAGADQGRLALDAERALPDLIRIMDLQQEQLARSLGEGHRVIHGVAGSGKTMILGFRCLHLAKSLERPILVLCYNKALAARLEQLMAEQGVADRVAVRNFHAWCNDQLRHYHVALPPNGEGFFDGLVQRVIEGVDHGQIPAGQYGAVLIDEGHDFQPEWLKLVAQMVDPDTRSLLLLYDDAQSIYGRAKRKFSFKSVGIQAAGRTTILRLNYRNTAEVLKVAYAFAKDVLTPEDADEDGIPLILPESAERHGPQPELIRLPSFKAETDYIARRLKELNAGGTPWRDMAVLYRNRFMGEKVAGALERAGITAEWLSANGKVRSWCPEQDSVKVVTFHSSKGLEFPVVAMPGLGYLPSEHESEADEIRLAYVAMTRAMDRLVMTCHRESGFVRRLGERWGGWRLEGEDI